MGLDIIAFSKLKPAPNAEVDDNGWVIDIDHFERVPDDVLAVIEETWPGRTEGIEPGIYSFEDSHGFKAGSYGGYNDWRSQLALMAHGRSADEIFGDPKRAELVGPFIELINFSDCNGYIGPVVSAKLAQDFANHTEQAERFAAQCGDDDFIECYRLWARAFELAADGGCVSFC